MFGGLLVRLQWCCCVVLCVLGQGCELIIDGGCFWLFGSGCLLFDFVCGLPALGLRLVCCSAGFGYSVSCLFALFRDCFADC